MCRSSESGGNSRRYTWICVGVLEMDGIFGMHIEMVIRGGETHGHSDITSSSS